jgi:hypothetical protein
MGVTVRLPFVRCAVLVVAWLSASSSTRAAEPIPAPTITLDLILDEHSLPPLTARVMRDEVVRIWAQEGIAVTWRSSDDHVPAGRRFVRLTLTNDVERPHRKQERYVLGDFLPEEGRIRISLFAASRTATGGIAAHSRPQHTDVYPLALGYVLGRAVAHEVGHVLLGKGHSESGLMQAAFSPGTMTDSRSQRFRLDDRDVARLPSSLADARLWRRDAGGHEDGLDLSGNGAADTIAR